jgi:nitrite reductase/ring-hydroxylating ferredoxin subunit
MKEIIQKNLLNSDNTYRLISIVFNDEIYVYYFNDRFHAISGFCPHFGGPLVLKKNKVECFWHGWEFHPENFNCTNHQVNCALKKYTVTAGADHLIITL